MEQTPVSIVGAAQPRINVSMLTGTATVLFFVVLYLAPLGYLPLTIPDEARYAEIPREMLSTGDWVVPHLNGLRYFEKPPLGYWIDAVSIGLFGENNFAARLSSPLAAGLTAWFVFLLAGYAGLGRRTAIAAAIIYMTFFEVYVVGTASVLDNLLTLFLTAGIIGIYKAATETRPGWIRHYWLASGFAFGMAFLTKGFLAFAVPVMVLVPWLLWEGRQRMILTHGWLALVGAAIVALPWALLINAREPDFWNYFFWVEHIKRFFADNAQHKAPFYYFLMYFPVLAFPWVSLIPAAFKGLRGTMQGSGRSAMRLSWVWLLLPFGFFSASSGKLATYILPCFVPLAVLLAAGLSRYLAGRDTKMFDFGVIFTTLVLGCLLIVLGVSQSYDIGFRAYGDNEQWRAILLATALILSISMAPVAILSNSMQTKLVSSLVMMAPLWLVLHFIAPEEAWEHQAPGVFLEQHRDLFTDNTIVISDGSMVHAATWYLKRDDLYLSSAGELAYGLGYPDASSRLLDEQRLTTLLATNASQRPVAMICKHNCEPPFVSALSKYNPQRYSYGEFVMWYSPTARQGPAS